ncbi:hypothetical protein HDU79_001482, partial [Rhizoclosmatium sp. JEL0117]
EIEFIAANRLTIHKNGGIIVPTSSHGVFISDNIVPTQTISQLAQYAAAIESESFNKNKWHEGSDEKVLDLIHPSDYCLVYRRSLKREKLTQLIGCEPFLYTGITYGDVSERFQWLPSEFKVKHDGSVEIRSYINNLNRRKHPEVQDAIKSIFESMVPLFERALGSFETQPENRIKASLNNNDYQQDQDEWQFEEYLRYKYGMTVDLKDQALREAAEADDELDEFLDSLWESKRFRPVHIPGLPKSFTLNGRDLQVIVKMESINLTPEKPSFTGGNWHLEGMENEAIAATGFLYYAMDNITSSRLTFRNVHEHDEDVNFMYEQHDYVGLEKVFNFENGSSINVQICGQIEARKDRCVVFPNFLHHRVEDFELQDRTRPGHQKILTFFLVHPDFKVISTADVGIQQLDWAAEDLFWIGGFGTKLPMEIVRNIIVMSGGCFSEKEAYEIADLAMEERVNTLEE